MFNLRPSILMLLILLSQAACKKRIRETHNHVYSKYLQRTVELSILTTPLPSNTGLYNLLLLNDGQDIGKLRVKIIIDSLFDKGLINPVVVVGINAGDRTQEYGVAEIPDYQHRGTQAGKYSMFIDEELFPQVKRITGVKLFKSTIIAGCSLGGLSALDIALDHPDKIDKAGLFSASFWWRDMDAALKEYSDQTNRIIINKIHSSHLQPHLKYWFYAGDAEEKGDRDNDGIIDVVDDTQDVIKAIQNKFNTSKGDISFTERKDGIHDYSSWSRVFPQFILWAIGKLNP